MIKPFHSASSFSRLTLGFLLAAATAAGCGNDFDPCYPPPYLQNSVQVPASCSANLSPSQPQIALATPFKSGTIELSWTVSFPVATSYQVQRAVNGGTFEDLRLLDGSINFLADADLKPNTQYAYRVAAINHNGRAVSAERSATTPSAADLGGDTIPTGDDVHLGVRVVHNPNNTTTTYACLLKDRGVVDFAVLDMTKKVTDLSIGCTWGVAPVGRVVFVVASLGATASSDLFGNTVADGTGTQKTLVSNALGSHAYLMQDLSIKMVSMPILGTQIAQITYDTGAIGLMNPLPAVSGINGSGVLQ